VSCPLPLGRHETVQLAHGGGGRLMRELIEQILLPAFGPGDRHDSAVLAVPGGRLAFTTDSYVVSPLVFPGGDIGKLAVIGTANDLAMAGATPAWLSAGFIIEEGFAFAALRRIVASMQAAAAEAGMALVTGDTKVVDRGKGDGLFLNTAGIGLVPDGVDVRPARVRPGDAVIVSGDLGRHGIALLSVREGLAFEAPIESDCALLAPAVAALFAAGVDVHCLRDLTRGGVAAALVEIALDAGVAVALDVLPVGDAVAGACEVLGLDPCYVANEGRFVAIVPAGQAARALAALRTCPVAAGAVLAGHVQDGPAGLVTLAGPYGGRLPLDLPTGEQLPRIC